MAELSLLQGMRFKGRLSAEAAAACAGLQVTDAQAQLNRLVDAGRATRAGSAARISSSGRAGRKES